MSGARDHAGIVLHPRTLNSKAVSLADNETPLEPEKFRSTGTESSVGRECRKQWPSWHSHRLWHLKGAFLVAAGSSLRFNSRTTWDNHGQEEG